MKQVVLITEFTETFLLRTFAFILISILLSGCGEAELKFQYDAETGETNFEELEVSLTEEQKEKLGGSLVMAVMVLSAKNQLDETGNCPSLFNLKMRGDADWDYIFEKLEGKTIQQIISISEKAGAEIEKECG